MQTCWIIYFDGCNLHFEILNFFLQIRQVQIAFFNWNWNKIMLNYHTIYYCIWNDNNLTLENKLLFLKMKIFNYILKVQNCTSNCKAQFTERYHIKKVHCYTFLIQEASYTFIGDSTPFWHLSFLVCRHI